MKYLITGISGHIAPHLAKILLDEGHEVHGTLRGSSGREYDLLDILTNEEVENIKYHYIDLRDYNSVHKVVDENKFDGVFHLASQSHPAVSFREPILTYQSNVIGSVNLITALQGSDTRLVAASTSEVYGDEGKNVEVLTEDMPVSPSNPYGVSKASMDLILQERIKNGFLDAVIVRPFSHLAPRRGNIFSISSDAYQLAKMMLGMQEPVLKIGNLNTERVVIDARDVARAYYILMKDEDLKHRVFNVCGDKTRLHKMEYYTDTLISLSHLDVEKKIHKPFYRDIDIQRQWGSSDRIRETGWSESYDIIDTLNDVLWYWVNKLKK